MSYEFSESCRSTMIVDMSAPGGKRSPAVEVRRREEFGKHLARLPTASAVVHCAEGREFNFKG